MTNLPVASASATVVELYRTRWRVEPVFQELALTLGCEIRTRGDPDAARFAFSPARVAANAVPVLEAALRAAHGATVLTNEVSGYDPSLEIRGTYDGMMSAIPEEHGATSRTPGATERAGTLEEIAGHVRRERYRKHPCGPKKSAYTNGGHVATARLLKLNE